MPALMRVQSPAARSSELAADQRGAIAIEYLAVAVVGLMAVVGLGAMAVELRGQYRRALEIVSSEYP
jgi:Flp pilus assembly pilin Flp